MDFQDVRKLARQLIEADNPRNELFAAYKRAYNMDWELKRKEYWLRETISPDAHNAVRGTRNILSTTAPVISVPHDDNNQRAKEDAEKTAKALRLAFSAASNLREQTIEAEAVHYGALDGWVVLKLGKTSDLAKAKGLDSKRRERYRTLAARCPFVVDVLDPAGVHIARGSHGLDCVVECVEKTVAQIRATWGPHDELFKDVDGTKQVVVNTYWDYDETWVWADGYEQSAIYTAKHAMPFLPYVVQKLDESLLHSVVKSHAWEWQNLVLTMMASQVFALGNMSWVLKGPTAHQYSNLDFTQPGTTFNIGAQDDIQPLQKDLISKDMGQLYEITSKMVEDSTVSKYVFGEAPNNTTAFASLNLLVQGGRLPIAPIQNGVGLALSSLAELMLRWVKFSKEPLKLWGNGALVELKPADIDEDRLEVTVKLSPDLPQDRLQLANVAVQLTNPQNPIISKETAREMIPGVNALDEDGNIWKERYNEAAGMLQMQKLKALMGQPAPTSPLNAPQSPPPQPQTAPPVGLPPTMATGQPPDEQLQAAARGGGPPIEEAL
jgi:hypothetical protein